MTLKPRTSKVAADKLVKTIRRKTRQTGIVTLSLPGRERTAALEFLGDAGRSFPCIERFEAMVANCLCGTAAGRN